MTTTPDLSEDYPALSSFAYLFAHTPASQSEAVAQEAQRALAELAGLRKDVANLLAKLSYIESHLCDRRPACTDWGQREP